MQVIGVATIEYRVFSLKSGSLATGSHRWTLIMSASRNLFLKIPA